MSRVYLRRQEDETQDNEGVFVSHSNKDRCFTEVTEYLSKKNIEFLSDLRIDAGNNNYIDRIKSLLKKSNGGVLILTEDSIKSPWVMYEIGMLEGMGKSIMIYCDTENLKLKDSMPAIFKKYPIIDDLEKLAEEVSNYSIFGDLFEHETASLSIDTFKNHMRKNVDNLNLYIEIDGIKKVDSELIKFGYIITRLARYGSVESKIEKCLVTREKRNNQYCIINEENSLVCSFLNEVGCVEAPETVILNKIAYYSRFEEDKIEYTVPFHKNYGVTFKCFVDVGDISIKNTMMNLLQNAGMKDVSYSESAEGQRIYFLLPEDKPIGLFEIVGPDSGRIVNNYFCPGCLIE